MECNVNAELFLNSALSINIIANVVISAVSFYDIDVYNVL